jgi:Fe-S cluster assembly protein SufB
LASATNSVNSTECDAMLLDDISVSDTIPTIISDNDTSIISHEATAGKIDEENLFYLQSK